MRFVIAAVAAAAVAGLAFSADAATSNKKKQRYAADKDKLQSESRTPGRTPEFGYDAMPEHYRVGSNEWWRAMDREGRGGFGNTP